MLIQYLQKMKQVMSYKRGDNLREYEVMVTETKQTMYEVEAASKEEAAKMVYKEYYNRQEQIGIDDSVRVDFEVDGEEIDLESDDNEYGFD